MALFEWTLVLLLVAVLLTAFSRRIGAPYPSLLALAGAGIAFLPSSPEISIDPELALALFVAPILTDTGFDTSPRDLKRNLLPLASLVLVLVALTVAAVAFVGWRWGGLPIAAAIALGAIVAPPDAVAAAAVLGPLSLPRRIMQILLGESLLNDAPALLIYRFAVTAAAGGLTLAHATPLIALAAVGSVAAGYALAHFYVFATRRVTDAASFTVLTFVGAFGSGSAPTAWPLGHHHRRGLRHDAVDAGLHSTFAAPARQLLFGVGDGCLRAQCAGVFDHGPANAPDPRAPARRGARFRTLVRRKRAGDGDGGADVVRHGL